MDKWDDPIGDMLDVMKLYKEQVTSTTFKLVIGEHAYDSLCQQAAESGTTLQAVADEYARKLGFPDGCTIEVPKEHYEL
jgi:hypothetical protein